MLICLFFLIEHSVASQMDPLTLDLSGTVSSISKIDLCTELGKLKGVCTSTSGYQIILRNVEYEVFQGPSYPDYDKGITHHKDSLLIYSTDTLFRTLIGKTISISKYDLRGDEFSMRPSIETLKITSAVLIMKTSQRAIGQKQKYELSIQNRLSKKAIHNYNSLLVNGRTGDVSGFQNVIKLNRKK